MNAGEHVRVFAEKHTIKKIVGFFLVADIALSLAYLANKSAGDVFSRLFDLDGEGNIPAWYSSSQLLIVGLLLGLFACHHCSWRRIGSWPPIALALFFVLLSADEAAQFHEWAGVMSDAILLGDAGDTVLDRMGTWMFTIGLPGVALALYLLHCARLWFRPAPGALAKLVAGMAIFAIGALGVEAIDNFLDHPASATAQVLVEETLEMIAVTVMLWGVLELLHAYGLSVRFSRSEPP